MNKYLLELALLEILWIKWRKNDEYFILSSFRYYINSKYRKENKKRINTLCGFERIAEARLLNGRLAEGHKHLRLLISEANRKKVWVKFII